MTSDRTREMPALDDLIEDDPASARPAPDGSPGDAASVGDAVDGAPAGERPLEDWEQEPPLPPGRVGLVVAFSTVAAAVVLGSVFEGLQGKVLPALAGLSGIGVAAQAARRRSALVTNLTIVLGIFLTGVVLVLPSGFDNVPRLVAILREAREANSVMRPPAEFLPGYRVIVGWLMACIGFAAGWIGIELRRPALGLLAPLPIIVMGAISVPASARVPAGLVALVLFVVGMTLLSSLQNLTTGEGQAPSVGYELRRALRLVPMLGGIVVLMVLASRTGFLFPPPLYDPVREAQAPKAVPLSEVTDRVLFQVRAPISGPWRIGLLDVYDGEQWRLPAFAESELEDVPGTGVVNPDLEPGVTADFLVKGLSGAVLPGLPNSVGVIARGPRLAYDPRTGSIRLSEGQIRDGLAYSVTAAALPTEDDLRAIDLDVPGELERFTEMPDPPPAVAAVLAEAPTTSAWDRLEFVRRRFLETVVSAGAGTPVPVPPSRVDDMLAGSKEGTPYEIVAAQAMLARWAAVPARIGYGYDGGEVIGEDVREVRPRHGASWLEVWFPGHGWLPLIGSPLKAKASLSTEGPTNENADILPSDDIAIELHVPLRVTEEAPFHRRVQRFLALLFPWAAAVALVYFAFPAAYKAWRRSRRRTWAHDDGPVARIEVAYAEFRDLCTDLGVAGSHETPIRFLDRVVDDPEHAELAWLVTRVVYGDLRDRVTEEDAAVAEELSRTLRRRLVQAQPLTLRVIASVSRLSLRTPYAPEARPPSRKEVRDARVAA